MPKLLQINVTVNSGSTGRIAEEIGQLAIANGWESYIAYGREKGTKSQSHTYAIGCKVDMYHHALTTRLFDREGLASKDNTKRLVQYIDKVAPDVIHLHNIHGYFINYPILFDYLATLRTPLLWTMHDCWSFTGHCVHFELVKCNRWITGCYNCPQKGSYPASICADRSKQNYIDKKKYFTSLHDLTLVPVSDWLARLTAKSFLKDSKINRIHNGVNVDVFKPQSDALHAKIRSKYGLGDRYILLGVASVWSTRKGLDDFVRLSKILSDDMVIVLVGLNSKQIQQLPKNIIGISRTENVEELAGLYSVADIFVNPTYEDNFPTTNIESLACGTPVITYNTGGSIEAIDASTGLVVEQNDIESLRKAVETIKNNKDLYTADICRQRVVDNFNKSDRFVEYIDLYKARLNSK